MAAPAAAASDVGDAILEAAEKDEADARASQVCMQQGKGRLAEVLSRVTAGQLENALGRRAGRGAMLRLLRAVLQGPAGQLQIVDVMREAAVQSAVDLLCAGRDTSEKDADECFKLVLVELDTLREDVAMALCDKIVDACVGLGSAELWAKHCGAPLQLLHKCLAIVETAADRMELGATDTLLADLAAASSATAASPSVVDEHEVGDVSKKRRRSVSKDGAEEESDEAAGAKKRQRSDGGDGGGAKKARKLLAALRGFKGTVLERFCEESWPKPGLVKILSELCDIEMDKDKHLALAQKAVAELKSCELQQLFGFVYQLLRLADGGHCSVIMRGIAEHFQALEVAAEADAPSLRMLRDTESPVIYAVNFAASQDEGIAKDFLKLLRSDPALVFPFTLALALAIAHSPRLEGAVFSTLFRIVGESLGPSRLPEMLVAVLAGSSHSKKKKLDEKGKRPEQVQLLSQHRRSMLEVCLEVARLSAASWDFVTQSHIKFAFHIIDRVGAKTQERALSDHLAKLCTVGQRILIAMFAHHSTTIQGAVLESVCNKIASQGPAAQHYVEVIRAVVVETPRAISPFSSKLRAVIECLPRLPPVSVSAFLAAVQSILARDKPLLDVAMISLRKSLFGKDVKCRESAVAGLCQLARGIAETAISQGSAASDAETAERSILHHEIFGLLRRALDQQCSVKSRLFQEAAAMALGAPSLHSTTVSLLLPHVCEVPFLLHSGGGVC